MQYRGLELDGFQAKAIRALEAGSSVLVAAPTGTGKTLVADWMVERALSQGRNVIYTAPIKALSNQKFRDYRALYGEEKTGLVTGDLVIRRDAPLRVMTTEILRNMLLTGDQLPDLAAVIIDEIHFLDDPERGTVWEEVLIYLDPAVQVVGLSATLPNLADFATWLEEVRGGEVVVVEEHKRAVPLTFGVASRQGGLRRPPGMDRFYKEWARSNGPAIEKAKHRSGDRRGGRRGREEAPRAAAPTRHTDVFRMIYPDDAPYLYFVFSRRDAEGLARQLARMVPESLLSPQDCQEVERHLAAFLTQPGAEAALDPELASMYRKGIAFHHAGLHVHLKALVEELYEARLISALYCTGTFALGINMPAKTTVFDGMMRYDGRQLIRLPTREFMQMAGRAGRRGMDEEGLVLIRVDLEDWPELAPQLQHYLKGDYEPVQSRFSLGFHSVVNLLERHSPERIRKMVERSFLAWGRRNTAGAQTQVVERMRAELEEEGWAEGESVGKTMGRKVRHMRRLEAKVDLATDRTWAEFEEKVEFLVRLGYLAPDRSLLAGAAVVRCVQFQEIFVAELFLAGILEDLDIPTLYGVLCGMCNELAKGVFVRSAGAYKKLGNAINKIRTSGPVLSAEQLSGQRVSWDPQMIGLGKAWAEGRPLPDVLDDVTSTSDISGDLVGAFRRAKDLVGQLKLVYTDSDPDRAKALERLARAVTRDEVEVLD